MAHSSGRPFAGLATPFVAAWNGITAPFRAAGRLYNHVTSGLEQLAQRGAQGEQRPGWSPEALAAINGIVDRAYPGSYADQFLSRGEPSAHISFPIGGAVSAAPNILETPAVVHLGRVGDNVADASVGNVLATRSGVSTAYEANALRVRAPNVTV